MTTFTREQLEDMAPVSGIYAFALALLGQKEKAEAERDEANDERDDAVDRWARRAREAEATVKDYLTVQAERDRLRAQLDSILANSDSLESGKLADANAEIARLREELLGAKVAWDMCDAVNRGLRAELREAEEAIREAIEELSDGVTFEDERVSYVEMQVGREWRIEWLQSPAVRRARERAGRG